jgi:5-methyltetrahydrofolate--homocysteine methyltransferase
MDKMNEIAENLVQGKNEVTKELVREALDEGLDAEKILREGLLTGMSIVGDKFKKGEFYLPEVILAARTMKTSMEVLRPILISKNVKSLGVVVMGTVKGDLHDIGKNLVNMMLEGAGFEVIDLGIDVPKEKFIQVIKERQPNILGLSALLTTTMPAMKGVITALENSGLRERVRVMVGGASITEEYADKIGADGYAREAASAVDKAKELLK